MPTDDEEVRERVSRVLRIVVTTSDERLEQVAGRAEALLLACRDELPPESRTIIQSVVDELRAELQRRGLKRLPH